MPNIALGKLPLEKEKWKNAEQATNGDVRNYTGTEGFATANWPEKYTLDIEKSVQIFKLRVLIWDGLGESSQRTTPVDRMYRFGINISNDGKSYQTIFHTQPQDEGNGWYTIDLLNGAFARFVQMDCQRHDKSKQFHIVEIEIYDEPEVESLNGQNGKYYSIVNVGTSSEDIAAIIESSIADRSKSFDEASELVDQIEEKKEELTETLQRFNILKESLSFHDEAGKNKCRSLIWLGGSIILSIVLFVYIYYAVYSTNQISDLAIAIEEKKILKLNSALIFSSFLVAKALLISAGLLAISLVYKGYRSERHNYTVNMHKAMALTTASGILTKKEYDNIENKEAIFNLALEVIFSHQPSAYQKEEGSSNIVNSLVERTVQKNL